MKRACRQGSLINQNIAVHLNGCQRLMPIQHFRKSGYSSGYPNVGPRNLSIPEARPRGGLRRFIGDVSAGLYISRIKSARAAVAVLFGRPAADKFLRGRLFWRGKGALGSCCRLVNWDLSEVGFGADNLAPKWCRFRLC